MVGQGGAGDARRHDHSRAIRQTVSPKTQLTFSADGSDIKNADAVVVVIGEPPYAEMKGDRKKFGLPATDIALVQKARSSGAPVTTILLSGRPLVLGKALNASDAFIAAWLPGTEGLGITDLLFGDDKFTGKLPCPWLRDDQSVSGHEQSSEPLFLFGFGLTD